ncbi:winged helix-turn-helix domain-containing protein [Halomonas caseinilytica]|uniref:Molybdate transport system regulatory protein n=1 Tax=Halomonas caseinilytica TaxID=438744 RepID=A0A1M6XKS4_9GAMM|nr:winged helix-turn-helix domain-containing protein [Halomonas caseinilytica]SEM69739.1 molybdate transport system regulatory protein [Halomonas caseinilytica]SHL06518.1 molybdate transport system regulatory protein [Halomonas caseinilytica]
MTRTRHEIPSLQLRLVADKDVVIGPGKADLLDAIARTGSIASASRELGMSYKKAWQLVATMNRHLPEPVLETASGGQQRGGARLTPTGHELLARYRALQALLEPAASPAAERLLDLLAPDEGADPGAS